jgi:hypothetical protein
MALAALLASVACLATPVHGDVVRAGPFVGGIAPQYDVVNGRFRLHVGEYRDRAIGLSQKVPWFIARSYAVGPTLVVRGRRLGSRRGRFKTMLQQASSENDPHKWIYPSSFSPPSAGCWRLTFHSGRVTAALTVLVSNRPASRDPWEALHRPLRLPHLAPGAECPRSATQPAPALNPAFGGYVLGPGPAYAGAFAQDATVHYGSSPVEAGGWRGFKVLWIVRPGYRDRLLIRGRQLDGQAAIQFAGQTQEMRIGRWGTASGAPGWGHRPSTEWVRTSGCYGFQLDGPRFSRVLVFRAEP